MFKNYLIIAYRNFKRDKVYSSINIIGLSIGMAAFILVALLMQFLYSFDTFHPNYKRIFRVQQEIQDESKTERTFTVYPLANELKNTIPEIQEAGVLREIWSEYLTSKDEIVIKELNGFVADPQILKILSFNFLEGNPNTALSGPGLAVLSKSTAKKLFPNENPMGKMFRGSFTGNLIVTGIFENYPMNSHIRPAYLVSFSTMDKILGRDYSGYKDDWKSNNYRNYVLIKKNTNAEQVDSKIKNLLDSKIEKNDSKLYLKPIKEALIYATKESVYDSPIPYYAAISVFILILACINFINLTTARSGLREKEIGIRKVVGGSRLSLVKQFIGESVIMSVPAIIIAFVLVKAFLPVFNSFMKSQLELSMFANWQFILAMIAILLLVGMLAGIYPAFYLSSLRPISALHGSGSSSKPGKTRKGILRRILVAFQFQISITLILTTVFMFKQVQYMKIKDLGYNKKNLLWCNIESSDSKSNFTEVRNQLLANPKIINATVSLNSPAHATWGKGINWEGSNEDQHVDSYYNIVDYNFINTFQMKIVKGRNFSREFSTDSNACLINETFASQVGWNNPIGKKLWDGKYTVIGIVKDFHPNSVHKRIRPYVMILHNGELNRGNDYCMRISPDDISQTMKYVRSTFRKYFPNEIFELQLYDADFDRATMAVWEGVQSTFGFFSVLVIILALIGLLGLVSFSTRRRTKEIGIRKVMGASESGLYFLVAKEFLIILFIAIVLSIPAAYIILNSTPAAYKYRTTAMDYLIPIVLIIAVTIIVTLRQVLSVTRVNPSESLRYE